MMKLLLAALTLLASNTAAKTCLNATVDVPVTSRNGVFDKVNTPRSNIDAATFTLNAVRQGTNGTQEALSGYATVQKTYKISTQYCMPDASVGGGDAPVLQVLTHGIGFDKTYWDIPFHNYNYSYVDNALSHGYHTLSYDRLGLGNSSHGEPKNEIQSFLELAALARLTKMVRQGSFPGAPLQQKKPAKVVHVGHSFGSGLTYALSAMYPDLTDGIVLTGFSMNTSFTPYFLAGSNFQQAHTLLSKDNSNSSYYPPGYLVSSNINANEFLFFYPPYFDRDILAFAEQNKKPVAVGELLTMGSVPMQSPFAGPVLIITGDQDLPFCGGDCSNTGGAAASIPAMGQMAFPDAKTFEAYVQPNTGHGLNLHYNATAAYDYVAGFLGRSGLSA